jgi:hypothetical protein
MEESGSTGLEEFLDGDIAKCWFKDVNSVCIVRSPISVSS